MSQPRVSVVVPCYNRAGTVGSSVRSVLEQSFSDLELIVVDDGSTDTTLGILDAIDDPRLQILRKDTNAGVSAARNSGIATARAQWVAFQDSDDIWHPDKLARQMNILEAPGANHVAAYCGMEIEMAGETRYVPQRGAAHREGDVLPGLVWHSFISTQTLIIRREILQEVGGFDEDLRALVDWELMLRVAQSGPVALIDEPLVRQRFSSNSITNDPLRRVEARAALVAKHTELIDSFPGALAAQHYTLSGGFRRCGQLERAALHMAEARKRKPWKSRWWLATLWLWAVRQTQRAARIRAA